MNLRQFKQLLTNNRNLEYHNFEVSEIGNKWQFSFYGREGCPDFHRHKQTFTGTRNQVVGLEKLYQKLKSPR